MRRSALLFVVATFAVLVLGTAAATAAPKIVEPAADPVAVGVDPAGNLVPFTVKVTGLTAGSQAWIEQCDGTTAGDPKWSPVRNCDVATSPAAAIVATDGTATFAADDPNHAFRPTHGAMPQGLFNCLAPGEKDPDNGAPSSTSCVVRVSSNNTAVTADQVFRALRFTDSASASTSSDSSSSLPIVAVAVIAIVVLGGGALFWRARRPRVPAHRR